MADKRSVTIVEQVPYDPAGEGEYDGEALKIRGVLGSEIVEICHIGSTSIRGTTAKPIIDIIAGVRKIEDVDLYNSRMAVIGTRPVANMACPDAGFS